MRILAISGSLKARSTNASVVRAVAECLPATCAFTSYEQQLAAIPAFNPDLDEVGAVAPAPVAELRALLAAADAVVVASPEYAHGVPGALKNAFDWIVSSGEFTDKPVLLLVTSPSGGPFARAAWRETLTVMGARVVADEAIAVGRSAWGADGRLTDDPTRQRIGSAVLALLTAVEASGGVQSHR